jgi:hypothetical protein
LIAPAAWIVGPDLSIPGHPEVSVIGDLAAAQSDGKPVPGIAPAAKQMGRHVAKNILRRIRGEQPPRIPLPRLTASWRRSAAMRAVAYFGSFKLSGYPAWLAWLLAHIYFLINFRSRLVVMIDWRGPTGTMERSARIVVGKVRAQRVASEVRQDSTAAQPPRSPLESPCTWRSRRVETRSENTYGSHSRGTFAYSRVHVREPAAEHDHVRVQNVITIASERASRSS